MKMINFLKTGWKKLSSLFGKTLNKVVIGKYTDNSIHQSGSNNTINNGQIISVNEDTNTLVIKDYGDENE